MRDSCSKGLSGGLDSPDQRHIVHRHCCGEPFDICAEAKLLGEPASQTYDSEWIASETSKGVKPHVEKPALSIYFCCDVHRDIALCNLIRYPADGVNCFQ